MGFAVSSEGDTSYSCLIARLSGSPQGSAMCAQGANRAATPRALGDTGDAHLARFDICLLLGFLNARQAKNVVIY